MRVSREDLRNLGACQEQCDLFAGLLEEDGVTSMEVTPEQVWRCLRRGVMAGWLLVLARFMQPGADLSEANLTRADLWGANLRDADLWGANLSGANLSDANLRGANLSGANQIASSLGCCEKGA